MNRNVAPRSRVAQGERASTRSVTAEVTIDSETTRIAPGRYVAEVVRSLDRPSPYKPKAPRSNAEPWKWITELRLEAGTDGRGTYAVERWLAEHPGRVPLVDHGCTFWREKTRGTIVPPAKGEKLHAVLAALRGRPLQRGDRIGLHGFIGLRVVVDVVDSVKQSDGRPRPADAVYSVARTILGIAKPSASAGNRQPIAYSRRSAQEAVTDQVVTGVTSDAITNPSDGSSGVTSLDEERNHDRLDEAPSVSSSPTPNDLQSHIERTFGRGADLNRGPACTRCGAPTFARYGENLRCVYCGPRIG